MEVQNIGQKQRTFSISFFIVWVLFWCLAGEFLVRLDHKVRYGLFFPLYNSQIHYRKQTLDYAHVVKSYMGGENMKQSFLDLSPHKEHYILSGGSTAWGWGGDRKPSPAQLLQQRLGHHIFDLSWPALTLKEELQRIKKALTPLTKGIIFISGYNDTAQVSYYLSDYLKCKKRVLTFLPFFKRSLFFHKIFKRIYFLDNKPEKAFARNLSQTVKVLDSFSKDFPKVPLFFFFQPQLSSKKSFSTAEKSVFAQEKPSRAALQYRGVWKDMLLKHSKMTLFDLQKSFESTSKPLFIDSCHLSETGTALLVEEIAKKMVH